MRTYNDEQQNSTLFQGEQAGKIVDLRKAMDKEASEICQRLHDAFNMAEEEFKQLALRYEPQYMDVLKGTELEAVPIGRVAFDFSNAEKHGIVMAREIKRNPIEAFLDLLRNSTENGPNIGEDDRIYFEHVQEKGAYQPDVARAWGSREKADA